MPSKAVVFEQRIQKHKKVFYYLSRFKSYKVCFNLQNHGILTGEKVCSGHIFFAIFLIRKQLYSIGTDRKVR